LLRELKRRPRPTQGCRADDDDDDPDLILEALDLLGVLSDYCGYLKGIVLP
jgi:hypothetical protein